MTKKCEACNCNMSKKSKYDKCSKCRLREKQQAEYKIRMEAKELLSKYKKPSIKEIDYYIQELEKQLLKKNIKLTGRSSELKETLSKLKNQKYCTTLSKTDSELTPDEWLNRYTFYCPILKCRIRPSVCELNRNNDHLNSPSQCLKCTDWEIYQIKNTS